MAVADTSLAEVAADVPTIGRVSLRTRKTLRGHLAKIYAMHWASDSRYAYGGSEYKCVKMQLYVCVHACIMLMCVSARVYDLLCVVCCRYLIIDTR